MTTHRGVEMFRRYRYKAAHRLTFTAVRERGWVSRPSFAADRFDVFPEFDPIPYSLVGAPVAHVVSP